MWNYKPSFVALNSERRSSIDKKRVDSSLSSTKYDLLRMKKAVAVSNKVSRNRIQLPSLGQSSRMSIDYDNSKKDRMYRSIEVNLERYDNLSE